MLRTRARVAMVVGGFIFGAITLPSNVGAVGPSIRTWRRWLADAGGAPLQNFVFYVAVAVMLLGFFGPRIYRALSAEWQRFIGRKGAMTRALRRGPLAPTSSQRPIQKDSAPPSPASVEERLSAARRQVHGYEMKATQLRVSANRERRPSFPYDVYQLERELKEYLPQTGIPTRLFLAFEDPPRLTFLTGMNHERAADRLDAFSGRLRQLAQWIDEEIATTQTPAPAESDDLVRVRSLIRRGEDLLDEVRRLQHGVDERTARYQPEVAMGMHLSRSVRYGLGGPKKTNSWLQDVAEFVEERYQDHAPRIVQQGIQKGPLSNEAAAIEQNLSVLREIELELQEAS